MSTLINLGGESYSAAEVIDAIAASNDPSVDLSEVTQQLEAIEARLSIIEARLNAFPDSWFIN